MKRYIIKVTGIVQGVGFRPYIYKYACFMGVKGKVYNIATDVIIDIEGNEKNINEFINSIKKNAPVLAKINSIDIQEAALCGHKDFKIENSIKEDIKNVFISPDISICLDCESEIFDLNNRRYMYPFANCTNCGPRFTIIKGFPYDRINTTMDIFKMCNECLKEYTDVDDRRYHAQPISCFKCGPVIDFYDKGGEKIKENNPIEFIVAKINIGNIIAMKGLGGYHLVCDAKNDMAVKNLRTRKIREDKPFALMARNIEVIKNYCLIDEYEE